MEKLKDIKWNPKFLETATFDKFKTVCLGYMKPIDVPCLIPKKDNGGNIEKDESGMDIMIESTMKITKVETSSEAEIKKLWEKLTGNKLDPEIIKK